MWGWTVFLLLGSLLWFNKPIRRLVTLRAMLLALTSRALMIFSNVQFITSICPLAWGCPGEENLFLMPRFEQKERNLGCRTDDRCPRWSSWISRIYIRCFSIQSPRFLLLLSWRAPLLPLISWSNQLRRAGTLLVSYPVAKVPWYQFPIGQKATGRWWLSSFLLAIVGHSYIFGSDHTF